MRHVSVHKNPRYNAGLKKDWLVISGGLCVAQFDSRAEANKHRDKLIGKLPKQSKRQLTRSQELKKELRNTPRREIKKRRKLKEKLQLVEAQEGQSEARKRKSK